MDSWIGIEERSKRPFSRTSAQILCKDVNTGEEIVFEGELDKDTFCCGFFNGGTFVAVSWRKKEEVNDVS